MGLRKKNVVLIEVIQCENTEGFMKRFAVVAVILSSALAGGYEALEKTSTKNPSNFHESIAPSRNRKCLSLQA